MLDIDEERQGCWMMQPEKASCETQGWCSCCKLWPNDSLRNRRLASAIVKPLRSKVSKVSQRVKSKVKVVKVRAHKEPTIDNTTQHDNTARHWLDWQNQTAWQHDWTTWRQHWTRRTAGRTLKTRTKTLTWLNPMTLDWTKTLQPTQRHWRKWRKWLKFWQWRWWPEICCAHCSVNFTSVDCCTKITLVNAHQSHSSAIMDTLLPCLVVRPAKRSAKTTCWSTRQKRYMCPNCYKLFKYRVLVQRTHGHSHWMITPFKCEELWQERSNASEILKSHTSLHNAPATELVSNANVCGKTFAANKNLNQHKKAHAPPGYHCAKCGGKFVFAQQLKRHFAKNVEFSVKLPMFHCRVGVSHLLVPFGLTWLFMFMLKFYLVTHVSCPCWWMSTFLYYRFLITGNSFTDLASTWRLGISTVRNIVRQGVVAIWKGLQPTYMPVPNKRKWKLISEGFDRRWKFPLCLGAIDGKHCDIFKPPNSGSHFRNYKQRFSVILMACVDADYKFTMIDVGQSGANNDAGVFRNSSFGQNILEDDIDCPEPVMLETGQQSPFVFVGDEAFPLKTNLMRPFPGGRTGLLPLDKHIYNWRHSLARKVVENAFGILAHRFRIYHRKMQLEPDFVTDVISATCVLHNYLTKPRHVNFVVEDKRGRAVLPQTMTRLQRRGHHAARAAELVRENFMRYFMSQEGEIDGQEERSRFRLWKVLVHVLCRLQLSKL